MSEKNSLPLFLEDIYDALGSIVERVGGAKAVARVLWPHKPVEQGRKELLDCLNRENPRKFDPEEVMAILRIGREAGYHVAKHWIDAELGYGPTPAVDAEDELGRMLREYLELEKRRTQLQPKIEEARLKVAR